MQDNTKVNVNVYRLTPTSLHANE